jgi:hypothetical protein
MSPSTLTFFSSALPLAPSSSIPSSKGRDEIFERFPVGYRRHPVYWNGALRLLQQSENFRRSDFLTPIPSAPETNYSFSHRNVNGRKRDIPFDLPNRIAFVGDDEDDRAGARRRRDFVQGLPRDE